MDQFYIDVYKLGRNQRVMAAVGELPLPAMWQYKP